MRSFRPDGTAVALTALVTLLGATPVRAQSRQSGLQITPDRRRILISKDVSGSRWAITRNLADGTVTGNVFDTAGGDPTFLSHGPPPAARVRSAGRRAASARRRGTP